MGEVFNFFAFSRRRWEKVPEGRMRALAPASRTLSHADARERAIDFASPQEGGE
jgi:hypothetical protein